jgi:hypothetical protein
MSIRIFVEKLYKHKTLTYVKRRFREYIEVLSIAKKAEELIDKLYP